MAEYPIEMLIIVGIEAVATVVVVIAIIMLWREVMVPKTETAS